MRMYKGSILVLLTGTVYDATGEPAAGAVIKIDRWCSLGTSNHMGYVVTDQFGEFSVRVEKYPGVYYRLTVFDPLLSDPYDGTGRIKEEEE